MTRAGDEDMKTQQCPTSGITIDGSAARMNGLIVSAILVAALATVVVAPLATVLLAGYLAIDFAIKVFIGFPVSPNCALARMLARSFKLARTPVDEAPKRFAALIGLLMSLAALMVLLANGSSIVVLGLLGFFLFCSALEGLAGVCVGCLIYGIMPQPVARVFVRQMQTEPRRVEGGA